MMEELLLQMVKDASGNKHGNVRQSAQDAHDFLESQQGTLRAPPYELRQKCLLALEQALTSKHNKLTLHAVHGFQKLLRDDRFHSSFECENEMQWLPTQMLQAISSIQKHSDEIQIEILKMLLNMACTNWWTMNAKMIQQLYQLCLDVYIDGSSAVRTAAQATSNQTLRSFCNYLEEESKSQQSNPFQHTAEITDANCNSIFEDVIPVFNYLCKKIDEYQRIIHTKGNNPLVLLLEGILTLISCLPLMATECSSLLNFLWQKLCPSLVAFLGSPRTDKNIISSQRSDACADPIEMGRGTGCLASAPAYSSAEARLVYNIAIKLVDLVGIIPSLRPMFESLFHRMLLYPPPQHRLEALKSVKEILKSPEMLLKLTGPPLMATKTLNHLELSLLTLIMDSIVECSHCNDSSVCYVSINCIVALLGTLEQLSLGLGFTEWQLELINDLYSDLTSSDYTGPFTYKAREEFLLKNELHNSEKNSANIDNAVNDECATSKTIAEGESDAECDKNDADDETGYQGDQEDVEGEERSKRAKEIKKHNNLNKLKSKPTVLKCNSASGKLDENLNCENCERNEEFHDSMSDSSGLTEGPEDDSVDEDEEIDESLDEAVKKLAEQEANRREKVPKTLLGDDESGKMEREEIERLCQARNEFAQIEKFNAKHFVRTLLKLLPNYLSIRSSIEVDEAFQDFASKYCDGIYSNQNSSSEEKDCDASLAHVTIINADGVYLATYSALSLNLKLIQNGYYKTKSSKCIPMSEENFVEEVHGSGVLVYLSTIWLSELYQQMLIINALEDSGYNPASSENIALINLLNGMDLGYCAWVVSVTDLDGPSGENSNDQLLSDYRRLEKAATNTEKTAAVKAGMKFSRRILTCCWNSVLEVLSILLTGKNSFGITSNIGLLLGMEGAKEEHRKTRDAIASSLEGLQMAARLCNSLGLQARCSTVFALLADSSCPKCDSKSSNLSYRKRKTAALLNRPRNIGLHISHILSMDVLLNRGLELGSHSPDCWRHVFRCCIYIADLEHNSFSKVNSNKNSNSASQLSITKLQKRLNESQGGQDSQELEFCGAEENSFHVLPTENAMQSLDLSAIAQKTHIESTSGIISNGPCMLQIICGLSQQIDRLFDDAAGKLNLRALTGFLAELCAASQIQLFTEMAKRKPVTAAVLGENHSAGLLLLYRLGDVMLKCIRSGRPLIHIMKAWSVVGPHFMEAACHKDRTISKKAISCIHDIVTALLAAQSELPHFHFNEALFKPFENLLNLELCDIDVQDQIISSICEFVEGSTMEIRSGWRPLFGTLRAVNSSSTCPTTEDDAGNTSHMNVVLDVFEAFLNTNNVLVFANAAIDCILCLMKHVRGSAERIDDKELVTDECSTPKQMSLDLCLASLKYIHRCSSILASMYQMPTCPIFHAAHRIKSNSVPLFVDPIIPNLEVIPLDREMNSLLTHQSQISIEAVEMLLKIEPVAVTLEDMDPPSGILHVWFLLLEGLVGAVSTCERKYQPYTMEALFTQLRALMDVPGPEFGIYSINHLLLPMLQSWLRRTSRIFRGWDNYTPNFKQCCGLTTDLIVDYISKLHERHQKNPVCGLELMIKQLLLVLMECVAQPTESISRLGCACLRHVIVSAGPYFSPSIWELVCLSLHRACTISLHSLYQLMEAFHAESDNFYGDIGQVKVATRRDSTPMDTIRLQQLAQQVFLLDSQQSFGICLEPKEDDNRSFIVLLYPPNVEHTLNPDLYTIRVPFRNLVVGLLSHLILLQTVGTLLLQGSPYIVPSLANVLLASPATTPSSPRASNASTGSSSLPGVLSHLPSRCLQILLDVLVLSYHGACEFDLRPGMKFLIQKVAQAEVAANLYKQEGASWTMQAVTLLHIVIHSGQFQTANAVKAELRLADKTGITDGGTYLRQLHRLLKALCERYVEMVTDSNGRHALADKMSEEPLFFLVAQPDDFPELKTPASPTDLVKPEIDEKGSMEQVLPEKETLTKKPSIESSDGEIPNSDSSSNWDKAEQSSTALLSEAGDKTGDETKSESSTKVYTVATQKDIDSMMTEYKRRKNQHSMPYRNTKEKKKEKAPRPGEHVPEELAVQKTKSLLKDSEAHLKVCGEMLLSVFDLLCQLEDEQFIAFLPLTFPVVRTLVAYAKDATLRQTTAEYLQRVASLHGFTTEE